MNRSRPESYTGSKIKLILIFTWNPNPSGGNAKPAAAGLGYTAQSHFLGLPRVTHTSGAHWGLKIWFFLGIKCLHGLPNGLLVYLDSLPDISLVSTRFPP
jgi:hypothetical protein